MQESRVGGGGERRGGKGERGEVCKHVWGALVRLQLTRSWCQTTRASSPCSHPAGMPPETIAPIQSREVGVFETPSH